jgi:hypothetical protein
MPLLKCSVQDPWHFETDWITDPDLDPNSDPHLFVSGFREANRKKSYFAF